MCFYTEDYDWTASCVSKSDVHADGSKRFNCDDCHRRFGFLEVAELTEFWEHETCGDCGLRHSDDYDREDDQCMDTDGEPILKDQGESCHFYRCKSCLEFREGIRDLEIKEGCREWESVPQGSIGEEFDNMDDDDRIREYVEHAAAMFPARADDWRKRWIRRQREDKERRARLADDVRRIEWFSTELETLGASGLEIYQPEAIEHMSAARARIAEIVEFLRKFG